MYNFVDGDMAAKMPQKHSLTIYVRQDGKWNYANFNSTHKGLVSASAGGDRSMETNIKGGSWIWLGNLRDADAKHPSERQVWREGDVVVHKDEWNNDEFLIFRGPHTRGEFGADGVGVGGDGSWISHKTRTNWTTGAVESFIKRGGKHVGNIFELKQNW